MYKKATSNLDQDDNKIHYRGAVAGASVTKTAQLAVFQY